MPEVVLYSKPGCHLCDEVKAQLAKLQETYPFQCREVNILQDPRLVEEYREKIPVVFVNGQKAFQYRLNEEKFARQMQKLLIEERKSRDGP